MKIITGASGGIGKELFNHYSKTEPVVGTFLKNGEIDEFMYQVDVTSPFSAREFANDIDFHEGEVTLILCHGVSIDGMAHKADYFDWAEVVDVNLTGTFNVIRAFLPFMRKHNYGRIINMGSIVAQKGTAGASAYAASKAGLWGMSKAMAVENITHNITINTLNLGYINRGMGDGLDVPKKGDIRDIIKGIDFLVDSPFVTGTSIDINGGLI